MRSRMSVVEVEWSTQTLAVSVKPPKSALDCTDQLGSSSLIETATAATCLDQTPKTTFLLPYSPLYSTLFQRILTLIRNLSIMAGDPRALLRQVGRTSKLSYKADS